MRRRAVLAGVWLLATVAATVVGWAAVRQVAGQVAPAEVLPMPAAADEQVAVGETPAGEPAARATDGATPPSRRRAITEAYTVSGGVVTVRYVDGSARLVGATPNSGFDVDVHESGPGEVEVRFRSDEHESRVVAQWRDGAADPHIEERPR